MAYRNHSIQLADEVWEALKSQERSANQILREVLSVSVDKREQRLARNQVVREANKARLAENATKERQPLTTQVMRPTQDVVRSTVRPHALHSGTRPIEGCKECAEMAKERK